jgi:uncharacterized protein YaiL (DUF2058 family)
MSGSLKDQLLALGFKPAPKPASSPGAKRPRGDLGGQGPTGGKGGPGGKASGQKPQGGGKPGAHGEDRSQPRGGGKGHAAARDAAEIDLAKAYALRAKVEREEKERLAREAAEKARLKAERKEKIAKLLDGAALNLPEAELPRHFEYGGKIRRVYVDQAQLAAINRGELGVVQHKGRFLIVTRELAREVHAIEPALLALLVDPDAPATDDVPPDLVW